MQTDIHSKAIDNEERLHADLVPRFLRTEQTVARIEDGLAALASEVKTVSTTLIKGQVVMKIITAIFAFLFAIAQSVVTYQITTAVNGLKREAQHSVGK